MAVIATIAVLGLIAGLVIWAPWKSPPLLRPAGLAADSTTTSSVAFHWSRPATGPAPSRYLILLNQKVIGSVPGTVTSYRGTGLVPATAYQYQVTAVRDGKRSAPSAVLEVTTSDPPIAAARLQGPWTVNLRVAKGRATIQGGKAWIESWQTKPKCRAGACTVTLSGITNWHYRFKMTLTRAGAVYRGKTKATVFPCLLHPGRFPIHSTLTVRLTVATAQPENGAWVAGSWKGTIAVSSPYTTSGNYYCNASHQMLSLYGNPP